MNKDNLLNLLGFAHRAGQITSGDFIVEKSIKRRDAKLVVLAGDCAPNNEKKYIQLCETYNIPLHKILTKEELGTAIGKEIRVVIAIHDSGFVKALLRELDI